MRWSKFDVGIAAFAGLSAAFVAYAAPDWRLFQLIFSLHLNDIVPALEPPIGNKIRLAAMVASAALVSGLVFGLMRLLDRVPAGRRGAAEPVPEVLRLRRADVHPDAPARRPLLAGRELGEPEPAEAETAPAPEPAEAEAEAAPAPAAPEPAIPEFLAVRQPEEAVEAEPEPLELTAPAPEPEAAPAAAAPEPPAAAPEADPEPEPRPEVAKAQGGEEAEAEEGEESLSKLMRRLESGIGRREAEPAKPARAKEQALSAAPPAEEAPAAVPEFQPPARNRLRSAIQDLEKLAGSR